MLIRDLFVSDVTRDIPPVVYFHEQSPEKLAAEVNEYIVTGGWPDDHPNHRRVPDGIHEQYVRLLTNIGYSGGSGTRNPEEVEHRFRRKWNSESGKWNTESGGSGTSIPEEVEQRFRRS